VRTQYVNRSKTFLREPYILRARSIPLTFSQKRCTMVLIFVAYKISSCVDYQISFSSHIWMFISPDSRMSPCFIKSCHQPLPLHLVSCTDIISLPSVLCPYVTHSWLFHISPVLVAKSCGAPFALFLPLYEMLFFCPFCSHRQHFSLLFLSWMY
jgi:hypothetical protein